MGKLVIILVSLLALVVILIGGFGLLIGIFGDVGGAILGVFG